MKKILLLLLIIILPILGPYFPVTIGSEGIVSTGFPVPYHFINYGGFGAFKEPIIQNYPIIRIFDIIFWLSIALTINFFYWKKIKKDKVKIDKGR